jgi:ABC-type branched-subunit amino acid transport system substrate-binding protein
MVEEGVVATIGDLTFVNPAGVKDVLEAEQIPRIGLSVGNPADFGSNVAFPVSAGPVGEFVADAVGIAAKGDTKVALGLTDTPTAGALQGLLRGPFEKAGVEIVGETRVTAGATDYSPYVADVQSAGADAVILALAEQPAAQFVAAMEQLNSDVRLSGLTPSFSIEVLRDHDSITERSVLVNSLPYPSANNVKRFPGLKTYFDAMKASGKSDLRPKSLLPSSLRPWVAMLGFVRATANLDEITKETVLQALKTEQDLDMDGLIPPWTPGAPGYSIFTAVSNPYVYTMSFDGKNVVTKKKPINIAEYFE